MAQKLFRLGSRGSRLALAQAREIVERLQQAHAEFQFSVSTIATTADRRPDAPLATLGLSVFVKELETALLKGEIDGAVHSLKDLPTEETPGLVMGAVTERGDVRDALVDRWGCTLETLPSGARIGTSSPRRAAQLRAIRPDLRVLPIRGNVDTRLRKALGDDYDGVVVAAVGLKRLGLEEQVSQYLPAELFLPAPGQGALVIQVRQADKRAQAVVASAEHTPTRMAVEAERAFLLALGGGCMLPVGAYATVEGNVLELRGMLAAESGERVYRGSVKGDAGDPQAVGQALYQRLLELGAGALMAKAG